MTRKGGTQTPEARAKISAAMRGRKTGRPSPATLPGVGAKISAAHRAKLTPEQHARREKREAWARIRREKTHCDICEAPFASKTDARNGVKVVDHCHATGFVRGVLCRKCNLAIGNLGDTSEGVMRAVVYLQNAERAELAARNDSLAQRGQSEREGDVPSSSTTTTPTPTT